MAGSTGSLRPVPAVEKTARVLRALADGGRPQGISELARTLGVSKGTPRDILLTLAAHGFVVRDPDKRFRLRPALPGPPARAPASARSCGRARTRALLICARSLSRTWSA